MQILILDGVMCVRTKPQWVSHVINDKFSITSIFIFPSPRLPTLSTLETLIPSIHKLHSPALLFLSLYSAHASNPGFSDHIQSTVVQMLGGLYGDLPPPSSTDDENRTPNKNSSNVWSSSHKMAPSTLRKPAFAPPPDCPQTPAQAPSRPTPRSSPGH